MSALYGIVSTKNSENYTTVALKSFFENTVLTSDDHVVVIDNDGSIEPSKNFDLISRSHPQSFAANVNCLMAMADANNQDLVFLSNDIYFPPKWNLQLTINQDAIILPTCNQTHTYEHNGFRVQPSMTLDQTVDYSTIDQIALYHCKQSVDKVYQSLLMPFYAFKIEKKIYKKIGYFDTSFGVAGAEDVDYRIRAAKLDIPVLYTGNSWLLHFGGKSTWDGAETPEQTVKRDHIYKTAFAKKWGTDLASLLLVGGNSLEILHKHNLEQYANSDGWFEILKKMVTYDR